MRAVLSNAILAVLVLRLARFGSTEEDERWYRENVEPDDDEPFVFG